MWNRFPHRVVAFLLMGLFSAFSSHARDVWVEAESFSHKGGWVLDQQFMDQMGSPYLLAHGMGQPVEDATLDVRIPSSGRYYAFVRTYNWTSPWSKSEGPGAFQLKVDGQTISPVLGTTGNAWQWQSAGCVDIRECDVCVALHDLTGFEGRCDAILFSKNPHPALPGSADEMLSARIKNGTLSKRPARWKQPFDLVVVGGGIGGMCTAVSAARLGLKVALVHDRPILGGNNSSEIRVHLGGAIEIGDYPALGRMIREFGHSKGGNAQLPENYEDWKKEDFIAAEKNITLFRNFRATGVRMRNHHISAVSIRHTESGKEWLVKGTLFCDCTGDGNLGYYAGADYRMGREGRDEYDETLAPEYPDSLTMGSSVQWYSQEQNQETSFPEFSYGMEFNEENCERVMMGEWTWETGMNRDQIKDFEQIRDYGMLVVYANWSYMKNKSSQRERYAKRRLAWVAYVAGKRESRRLLGDFVLRQDDVLRHVPYEDASFPINWHFDLHFPEARNSGFFPGREFKAETKNNPICVYNVPYRCLYSRNIDNLFMAGRCISTTHVTLGSTRLMRNIGMMGEVVGMAASLCIRHDVLPRAVYQYYLPELKDLMSKGVGKDASLLPDNQQFNTGGVQVFGK